MYSIAVEAKYVSIFAVGREIVDMSLLVVPNGFRANIPPWMNLQITCASPDKVANICLSNFRLFRISLASNLKLNIAGHQLKPGLRQIVSITYSLQNELLTVHHA